MSNYEVQSLGCKAGKHLSLLLATLPQKNLVIEHVASESAVWS